jgi:hypothetical protein
LGSIGSHGAHVHQAVSVELETIPCQRFGQLRRHYLAERLGVRAARPYFSDY